MTRCRPLWIEEIVELAEQAGSCPVYPVLKRPDERHVTMQAFDNPVFIEDMVSDVAVRLDQDHRVAAYRVEAQNQESIHNHDAFTVISSGMRPESSPSRGARLRGQGRSLRRRASHPRSTHST